MGVFRGTPLHRSRAIVTGGAVTACLMPWPKHIRQLYIEERLMAWIIESALGFPVEIGRQISSYVDNIQKAKRATDEALFDWLCSDSSVYGSSDIDVFFIAPLNATTVDDALDALPEMHRQISLHRSKANVRRYAHKDSNPGWVFDENWYHEVKQNYYGLYTPRRRRRTAEASTDDEDDRENGGERDDGNDEFLQDEDYDWFYRTWGTIQGKDWKGHFRRKGFHKFAKDGWTNYMEEAVAGRMALLPSIRTTNSVTMCGLWPVRHTQLMLPVVRAAEQVVEAFDLDCVRVFYDGQNVYATHRALRAFNTRTNFIDHVSARDNFRVRRMKKYQRRGFTPVYFDTCSHHPRCDVHAAQYVRDTLDRHVHPLEQEDQEDRNFQDDAMDGAHDYVPETIAYGSSVDLSALRRRIQPVVKGEGELRAWATALELPYTSVLSDPAVFRREISCPRTENPGRHWTFEWRSPTACAQVPKWRTWPPMQFKFVKDAWVQRKLHLLAAFDVCYMCGVDIEAEMRREKERLSGSVRGGKGSQSQLSGGLLDEQATSTKSGYFISLNDRSNDEKYSDEDYDSDEDLYVEGEVPDTPEKVPICSGCARINMLKREQKVAMHGVQCLVMGVEDEILFQTAVQMLEWGATVLVTTRFPLLTARRLKRLSGSGDWWNQIMVKYLNLSDMDAEGAFVQEIQDSGVLPALGVVINNTFGIPEGEANFGRLERAESKAVACAGPDLREICLDFESYEQIFSAAAKAPGKAPAFVPPAEVALANNRLLMNGLLPLLASPAPAAPSASVFVNVVPPGDMLPLSLPREPAIPNRIGDIASAKVSRTALLEFTRELFSLAACVGVCVAAVEPGWTARIPWVEAKPLCRRNRVYYRNAEEPLTLRKKTREELIIAPLDVQDGVARVLDVVIAGLKGDGERLAGGLVRHFLRVKE
ncbi:hypothetical protein HK104_006971 [Borealophlyctis nickersoniae]|nr:hypothetical protein HK104_006971 [Borealophlyctis nickersoniae]